MAEIAFRPQAYNITPRQQAFQQGLNQLMQAGDQAFNLMAQNEQTRRQRAFEAFKTGQELSKQGLDVTPEIQGQINEAYQSGDYGNLGNIFSQARDMQKQSQFQQLENQRALEAQKLAEQRQYEQSKLAEQRAFDLSKQQRQQEFDLGKMESQREFQTKLAQIKDSTKEQKRPGEGEFKAAGFAKRARLAQEGLRRLSPDVGTGIIENIPLPSLFKGEERKQYENTKNNFISAVLRKESGAAISDQEFEREEAKYFPQPGDNEQTLAQKEQLREQAILNLEAEGSRAMPLIKTAATPDLLKIPEAKTELMELQELRNKQRGIGFR